MPKYRPRFHTPGTSPGTLTSHPDQPAGEAVLTLVRYDSETLDERPNATLEECLAAVQEQEAAQSSDGGGPRKGVVWLHVTGMPDADLAARLQNMLGLHPLALEDVLAGSQRPKVEQYEEHLFVVLSHADYTGLDLHLYQTSLFLKGSLVVSIDSCPSELLGPIRTRLRAGGRMRQRGADYLLYALIDLAVDHKFPVLERLGTQVEEMEASLLANPKPGSTIRIHRLKRHMMLLRRALWPEREVLSQMQRGDMEPAISRKTQVFLRDTYDHAVQAMDLLETYREVLGDLQNLLLTAASNRLNDIIRVLTVISIIFMPLTFIVGVYGMNFDREAGPWAMPELGWAYGYPAVMLAMLGIAVGMLWFFKRRGWI
ncbi:MAG: magnesium/cobalt transporter CorA [Alphaproteobacteria bacterium]|nr:magnesium/cobalt transporter CorA [Alphaproteobacteria bacterium]MBU0798951.1 magnesium/cobalt transporter CorA [Alphaproteobacteria bacterium]MBU0887705.1 magnesium/cobalt transporter CorA [Alphaproteobacteria bacterium]MBU1812656.1 magnesium/cobalt transporter CorA [Alphaproteobacteria bacterium]MBU2090863.1 magnesium/cobalt transporter CorA [Alphaproteobacteria bacterium]